MTAPDPAARSRLGRLEPIRRARGYRLYDHRGRRFLDLWQGGGRALLGHRPDRALARIKGALSQGVNGALPSVYERRLCNRLRHLIPGFEPLLTGGDAEVRAVLQHLGVAAGELHDPAVDAGPAEARLAGIWRPLLGPTPPPSRWRAVVPVLPSTIGESPAPLCLPAGTAACELEGLMITPAPQPAPLLVAGLAGLDRLPRYRGAPWAQRAWPDTHGCAGWERRGPYVAARCDEAVYDAVFERFLRAGILLSPFHPGPSILPDDVSAGEAAALMRLFAESPTDS